MPSVVPTRPTKQRETGENPILLISTFCLPRSLSGPPKTVLSLNATATPGISAAHAVFCPSPSGSPGDDGLAEDVLQTSWIKILQFINHACCDGPTACPWVHRIVTNTAKDFHGKQVRRREDPLQDQRTPTRDPEALAQERKLLALLREMIDLLPGTYRQVIKLRFFQGFSNKEISRRFHVSRGNVAVRMISCHLFARARH